MMSNAFTNVVLPMIRQVMPGVMAQTLMNVQPMIQPANNLWNLQSKGRGHRLKYYFDSMVQPFDQKIGKGRKGQPHWRETRVLYYEKRYAGMWDIIRKQYQDYVSECYAGPKFKAVIDMWHWIEPLAAQHNARVVYDMVYRCKGLHFESMEDLITFKLTLA